jgi:hypothetical protein
MSRDLSRYEGELVDPNLYHLCAAARVANTSNSAPRITPAVLPRIGVGLT